MVQEHSSLTRLLAAAAVAVLLAGCPAPGPRPDTLNGTEAAASDVEQTPIVISPNPPGVMPPPRPHPAPRENHLSPATRSLVAQAKTLTARGDVDGASSTLDRALRIEPNNPLLWIELGKVRLAESDAHQAESCGRKALALASGDRTSQKQAGRLIADALRAQQRNPEAQAMESQPFMR